jgi:dCTP deaminase
MSLPTNGGTAGVLPAQMINEAIKAGWISSPHDDIPMANVQPASLDLRLGEVAYRLRCSFLPDTGTVEHKLRSYVLGEVDLRGEGAVLEQNRPYLVPVMETLSLPDFVRAKANPKSSTGRLDVFTRVVTNHGSLFDDIVAGYQGPLFLEIVPRTFAIRIKSGLTLSQLRLMVGNATLTDAEIVAMHNEQPVLFHDDAPVGVGRLVTNNGLFLGVHVGRHRRGGEVIGFRARQNSKLIELERNSHYEPTAFWDKVVSEAGGRVVLDPEQFYLLMSEDSIRIPPGYASEMTAYDPSSGELRVHYAGFFDPGFGWSEELGGGTGSRAALEVRAHDVPFALEAGQNLCKLSFERMLEVPDRLYGGPLGSNYQNQQIALGKHFRRERRRPDTATDAPTLF